jgi:membrane protease YdiL (CAAX protease family)
MNTNQSSTQGVEASRAKLTALAWGAILIGSMAPTIILRLFVRGVPAEPVIPFWLACAQVVVLTVLWAVTWVWPTVKPLRGFVLAVLAFSVGYLFIMPFVGMSAAWSNWMQQASWGVGLVAAHGIRLIWVALMALTLIGSGIGRRELFLVRGNPSAPVQPSRLLLLKEPVPWTRFAPRFLLVYVIVLVIVVGQDVRPDVSQISRALIFLPAIVIAAVINAFVEEFVFRSVPLSRLEPVVRPGQAMLMTAVLFASLHYYTGTPSGPVGALAVAYAFWAMSA